MSIDTNTPGSVRDSSAGGDEAEDAAHDQDQDQDSDDGGVVAGGQSMDIDAADDAAAAMAIAAHAQTAGAVPRRHDVAAPAEHVH